MSILEQVSQFLSKNLDRNRPVLLALSGGPDSLALLHLLLQSHISIDLHIAHIDHSWRKESKNEALSLMKTANLLGIPFHLKTLDPPAITGNLEDIARQARLQFFNELHTFHEFQAVLLAHHADDQAETVLKRIFEGASISRLAGLKSVAQLGSLTLWRPLLTTSKRKLIAWLESQSLEGFQDATNNDTRFLRARMRSQILPALSELFGKNVTPSLGRVGADATQLRDYLDCQIAPYKKLQVRGPAGTYLDLQQQCPVHPFELEFLLRDTCGREGVVLSRAALDELVELVTQNASNRQVCAGDCQVQVDRRRIFVVPSGKINNLAEWSLSICKAPSHADQSCDGIQELWQGQAAVSLPYEEYSLRLAKSSNLTVQNQPIGKWWSTNKVPAFLRNSIPALWFRDRIVHEFITGKRLASLVLDTQQNWAEVKINREEAKPS